MHSNQEGRIIFQLRSTNEPINKLLMSGTTCYAIQGWISICQHRKLQRVLFLDRVPKAVFQYLYATGCAVVTSETA